MSATEDTDFEAEASLRGDSDIRWYINDEVVLRATERAWRGLKSYQTFLPNWRPSASMLISAASCTP